MFQCFRDNVYAQGEQFQGEPCVQTHLLKENRVQI